MRTSFLIAQGWEPILDRDARLRFPVTMWRDPLRTVRGAGLPERRVMWPHEAEYVASRRIHLVRSVMED